MCEGTEAGLIQPANIAQLGRVPLPLTHRDAWLWMRAVRVVSVCQIFQQSAVNGRSINFPPTPPSAKNVIPAHITEPTMVQRKPYYELVEGIQRGYHL